MTKMTRRQTWDKLTASLRKPQALVAAAAIAGIIPALLLFTKSYLPAAMQQSQSAAELAALREERDRLSNSPMPNPFRQDELIAWLEKVPTAEDHASLLKLLLRMESDSGARIERFQVGEEDAPKDLVEMLAEAQAAAAPKATSGAQKSEPAQPLQSELVTLEVAGTFSEVIKFWGRLADMERVVIVRDWKWTTGSPSSSAAGGSGTLASAEDASAEQDAVVRLTLRFALYTAPSFADLAPERMATPAGTASDRTDPTVTDETFYRQLAGGQGEE